MLIIFNPKSWFAAVLKRNVRGLHCIHVGQAGCFIYNFIAYWFYLVATLFIILARFHPSSSTSIISPPTFITPSKWIWINLNRAIIFWQVHRFIMILVGSYLFIQGKIALIFRKWFIPTLVIIVIRLQVRIIILFW